LGTRFITKTTNNGGHPVVWLKFPSIVFFLFGCGSGFHIRRRRANASTPQRVLVVRSSRQADKNSYFQYEVCLNRSDVRD
jgi:hypothetical protein